MTTHALHILVRTNRYDLPTAFLVSRIRAEVTCPVTLVCDETRGPVETGDVPKIAMTEVDLQAWGWKNPPKDWGWFCGDACYYAAETSGLKAQYFLLIENDVFFNTGAMAALVAQILEGRADIGAAQLGRVAQTPTYSANLTKLGRDANVACIFPVTYVRSDLVARMHEVRRASLQHGDLRLNDEAILATVAHDTDVRPLDLAQTNLFPKAHFQTNPPNLLEYFLARDGQPGGHFAHPVVSFSGVFERIMMREKRAGRRRLRNILHQATSVQYAQLSAALDTMEAQGDR